MSIQLKLFLSSIILFQTLLILNTVNDKKLTIKYGVFWIFLLIFMEIVVIFPGILINLSEFIGFEAPSNMIFLLLFYFLFYISFLVTTRLSKQKEQIKTLTQELSILKKEIKSDEGKN